MTIGDEEGLAITRNRIFVL